MVRLNLCRCETVLYVYAQEPLPTHAEVVPQQPPSLESNRSTPAPPAQLGLVKRSSQTELGGGKLVHDALNSPGGQSIASAESGEVGTTVGGGAVSSGGVSASAKKVMSAPPLSVLMCYCLDRKLPYQYDMFPSIQ